ncbi:MAG: hypothetical protein Q7T87_19215 [Polaromonas sp.]|nr:hypothetical protein [Polaromonas sp.]
MKHAETPAKATRKTTFSTLAFAPGMFPAAMSVFHDGKCLTWHNGPVTGRAWFAKADDRRLRRGGLV